MSIMVDNIDVTKCSLYKDGKCRSLTHLVQGEYINCNSMCDYGAYARKEQLKRLEQENEENKHYLACMTEQRNKLQTENEKKDNLLKWLITQQYYIIPKKLKQKITEVLNG